MKSAFVFLIFFLSFSLYSQANSDHSTPEKRIANCNCANRVSKSALQKFGLPSAGLDFDCVEVPETNEVKIILKSDNGDISVISKDGEIKIDGSSGLRCETSRSTNKIENIHASAVNRAHDELNQALRTATDNVRVGMPLSQSKDAIRAYKREITRFCAGQLNMGLSGDQNERQGKRGSVTN